MKVLSDHFVNVNFVSKRKNKSVISSKKQTEDPLDGVGTASNEKFYRLESVVFAEPITKIGGSENAEDRTDEVKEEMIFIDNVTVQKRAGKRNKYHIDIRDTNNLTCPQDNCAKTFSTVTLLRAHIRKVHCTDKNTYICEQCGAGFKAKYLMLRHKAVHDMRKVVCPVCDKELSERTNLRQHMRTHTDTRMHECRICSKKFRRASTLRVHVQFVHSSGGLKCDKCGECFPSRKLWTQHSMIHRSASD